MNRSVSPRFLKPVASRQGPRRIRQANFTRLPDRHLKILSFNVQAGISTQRFVHYITQSWRHLLAHRESREIIDRVAEIIRGYDIVALQEVDAGSFRSDFLNQITHLAHIAGYPIWHQQVNRNFGRFGQFANAMFARMPPFRIIDHTLPGMKGRGAIVMEFGHPDNPLVVVGVHMALSRKAREKQLDYLNEQLADFQHVIIMGDLNCEDDHILSSSLGVRNLLHYKQAQGLQLHTYPSWQPAKGIDHILVSPTIEVIRVEVLDVRLSDHRPIMMEIALPEDVIHPA